MKSQTNLRHLNLSDILSFKKEDQIYFCMHEIEEHDIDKGNGLCKTEKRKEM